MRSALEQFPEGSFSPQTAPGAAPSMALGTVHPILPRSPRDLLAPFLLRPVECRRQLVSSGGRAGAPSPSRAQLRVP